MPWIRLDDQFPDHPKAVAAGPLASWLFVCGIGYCNRLLTDGIIPAGQVRKLADVDNAMDLAAKLVEVGLWEAVEGGYRIHDFLEYQPSAEQVKAERLGNAQRQQEWRDRQKGQQRNGVTNTVTDAVSNAPRNGTVTDPPYPYPPRTSSPEINTRTTGGDPVAGGVPPAPQPLAKPPTPAPKTRAKGATPAPDHFPITDDMRAWADVNAPDVDVDQQTARFLDRNRANGTTYKDWHAAWRNWLTSPYAKPTPLRPTGRAPDVASVNGVAMSPRMARNLRVLQETEL